MLQIQQPLQKDIQRSLDRLKTLIKQISAIPSIPAFYYSASLLQQYANKNTPETVRSVYFEQFKQLIIDFGKHDFSEIKKNHQSIVDDILEIVDSELFINCMRPDILALKSERTSRKLEYGPEQETLLAKSNYMFKINPKEVKDIFRKENEQGSPMKSMQSISNSYYLNQFDQIWERVERNYRQHNIDEAFKQAVEYKEKIGKKVEIPKDRQGLINDITEEYMEMTGYYEQFDKPGWIFDKAEEGITLQYKVYEQEKQIAIRITGQFPIPPIEFLSIVAEIDLMADYVPFCYDCSEVKQISRNQRIGTSKVYIPLLSDRQTYFYAVGYDRIQETGGLFLYSKTINENKKAQEKYQYYVPPPNEKFVRLEYKFFIVEYIPIGKGRAKIRLSSKVDMKMNYLPLFIINKSARIFAFDYFRNILKNVKNYKGSAWEKKVTERPEMYEFFFGKIKEKFSHFL